MPENIVQKALRRIRPGSGGPAQAISIVDGADRAPSNRPVTRPQLDDDEDFDDVKSGMPIARSLGYGGSPRDTIIPSGTLPGVDPKTGEIPYYQPDDPVVLARLFGMKGMSDG